MDPMISLGQKNTLAEYMILSGADNRPPMLDKDLYDSWKSRMELYMQNREHGRMILESVEHGPLIWPTVEEDGVIRTKKYAELSAAEKIQADCDMKATNIILQGLLADIYSLVNHHRVAKDLWERVQLLMQGTSLTKQERECKLYDAFDKFTHIKGESLHILPPEWSKFVTDVKLVKDLHASTFDQLHAYLEQNESQMNHQTLTVPQVIPQVAYPSSQAPTQLMTETPFVDSGFTVPVFSPGDDPIACLNKAMAFLTAVASSRVTVQQVQGRQGQNYSGTTYKNNVTSSRGNTTTGQARVVKCYNCQGEGHMARQCTQPKRLRNVAWYKEKAMLAEAQEKANKEQNIESITAELERYKERVKTFKQRLNIDLSSREKMIDSQMDDMIREKLTLKEQIDSLEQNLSKQIKEKEFVLQTLAVFKNESKEKENKYMENEIDLENKIKELDNIICKVGQSAQTVHMLTKPQAFYDNTHKQALGYQNLFYLKKAQRIKPTLYDGVVISNTHVAMPVIDDEETLILKEESRSKMFEKAKDPEVVAKKISHKPIDYGNLNSLIDDFGKRFSPQQEFSAEQAFWFPILNPTIEPSYTPPVIVDVPSELPKVSLVNASLKKLKFHLTQFDSVVKKRTTPSALEEGEWGFEHTKAVFNKEIIPFLKSFKDIFNVFDKDLLNEITEVQTVFDQMEASVQQFSIDKKCLEIAKKEILLENDRLLQKIMSQDVMLTVMNSMSLNNDYVNMNLQKCDLCETCLNLDAELSKSKQAYSDLLKNHSQLEKHCISLELSMQLKQEVFQNDKSYVSQNAVEIPEYFVINDLKARLQDKDTTICKLKDTIKSLEKNTKEKNVHHEKCDLEPINEEMENSVCTLL
ncbi:retrovirus-related pol polyprotein from transposon TNT 1-94 [Tanacetum coccineum]